MEQPDVELIVRVTARISAALFAAALISFAAAARRHQGRGPRIRLFIAFLLAHSIHFGAVMWLAALTAGENIRARGGWILVLTVAALFYLAAFSILRAWSRPAAGRAPSRVERLSAHAGVAFVALIFLNSYAARAGRMPVYWVPTILLLAVVVAYFSLVRQPSLRLRGR